MKGARFFKKVQPCSKNPIHESQSDSRARVLRARQLLRWFPLDSVEEIGVPSRFGASNRVEEFVGVSLSGSELESYR